MNNLNHLVELINKYPADIKAEVLIADLMEHGYSPFDFIIFYESLFKRRYSKDVMEADIISSEYNEDILAIYLARDGLYDLLPEGLFHESSHSAMKSGSEMALESRKELKIEIEARKFFRPIENEFFHHRVLIEMEERSILKKFHDSGVDDFFQRFWNIDQSFSDDLTVRLVSFLPFVKDIVGDYKMTAHCLASILNESVTYTTSYTTLTSNEGIKAREKGGFGLGETDLGVDFITDGEEMESHKLIKFTIGPLKNTRVEAYLDGGDIERFLEYFTGYFIPVEVDVSFEVETEREPNGFILEAEMDQPVMGYNTVI